MRKEIYTTYAPDSDMTFIIEEVFDEENEIISTECKGFYFGKPDDESTVQFYGDLKAEF